MPGVRLTREGVGDDISIVGMRVLLSEEQADALRDGHEVRMTSGERFAQIGAAEGDTPSVSVQHLDDGTVEGVEVLLSRWELDAVLETGYCSFEHGQISVTVRIEK